MLRGMKEARERIATLQSSCLAAFPAKPDLVRPQAAGIIPGISECTGWSRAYAQGVVYEWKARCAYCKVVLKFGKRFDLNGEPVDQTIEFPARKQVRPRFAAMKARIEARKQNAAAEQSGMPAAVVKTGENSGVAHIASAG